jgi:hypothetical protein
MKGELHISAREATARTYLSDDRNKGKRKKLWRNLFIGFEGKGNGISEIWKKESRNSEKSQFA